MKIFTLLILISLVYTEEEVPLRIVEKIDETNQIDAYEKFLDEILEEV